MMCPRCFGTMVFRIIGDDKAIFCFRCKVVK